MRRRGMARTVGLTIVSLFVVAALVYEVLQPNEGWPSEQARVIHPHGFSLANPSNWERQIVWGSPDGKSPDSLIFLPKISVGNPGKLELVHLTAPADRAEMERRNYQPTTFQGQPAWQATTDFPKTHDHSRSLIFERTGQWYELLVRRPEGESLTGGVWQAYFDSFRIEANTPTAAFLTPAASQPATRPASAAS